MNAREARELNKEYEQNKKDGTSTMVALTAEYMLDLIHAHIALEAVVGNRSHIFTIPVSNHESLEAGKEIMSHIIDLLEYDDFIIEPLNQPSALSIKIHW